MILIQIKCNESQSTTTIMNISVKQFNGMVHKDDDAHNNDAEDIRSQFYFSVQ